NLWQFGRVFVYPDVLCKGCYCGWGGRMDIYTYSRCCFVHDCCYGK
uniref:Phospholipase A2 3 (Fragments) n=1 Tax=Bothrops diporus TaxID=1107943 RepID=PLA23_BOTDP|nr:RecName: Full=Phospholipase A2 3; Short=BdsPLA2 III; Short=svPLA2; AltName: Full=Phosphatidylcholine 2-acylhydrolase [Bothrops diporus]